MPPAPAAPSSRPHRGLPDRRPIATATPPPTGRRLPGERANPLFCRWLREAEQDARRRVRESGGRSALARTYGLAHRNMCKYPLPLAHAADAIVVNGIGEGTVAYLAGRTALWQSQHPEAMMPCDFWSALPHAPPRETPPSLVGASADPRARPGSPRPVTPWAPAHAHPAAVLAPEARRAYDPRQGSGPYMLLLAFRRNEPAMPYTRSDLQAEFARLRHTAQPGAHDGPSSNTRVAHDMDTAFGLALAVLMKRHLVLKIAREGRVTIFKLTGDGLESLHRIDRVRASSSRRLGGSRMGASAVPVVMPVASAAAAAALGTTEVGSPGTSSLLGEPSRAASAPALASHRERMNANVMPLAMAVAVEPGEEAVTPSAAPRDEELRPQPVVVVGEASDANDEGDDPRSVPRSLPRALPAVGLDTIPAATTVPDVLILEPYTFDIHMVVDLREVTSHKHVALLRQAFGPIPCRAVPLKAPMMACLSLGDFCWVARCRRTGVCGMLDTLVERKTLSDLVASIKDGRFREQKYRLMQSQHNAFQLSPTVLADLAAPQRSDKQAQQGHIARIVYLIEERGRYDNAHLANQAVQTALAQIQILQGWVLQQTHGFEASCAYLARMTEWLQTAWQARRLRIVASAEPPQDQQELITCSSASNVSTVVTSTIPQLDVFQARWLKTRGMPLKQVWARQLQTVRGLSIDKSLPICRRFPTLASFWQFVREMMREGAHPPVDRPITSVEFPPDLSHPISHAMQMPLTPQACAHLAQRLRAALGDLASRRTLSDAVAKKLVRIFT
ncbi:hypothetical protein CAUPRSCDRAFT_10346 [Caulochytrium protostelioides]|nr:hypothetical protein CAUPRSCDRAFT_10346 [Caulochytrium protostelioides]